MRLAALLLLVGAVAGCRSPAESKEAERPIVKSGAVVDTAGSYAVARGRSVFGAPAEAVRFESWADLGPFYGELLPDNEETKAARASTGGKPFWLVIFQRPDAGDVFVLLSADPLEPVYLGGWID